MTSSTPTLTRLRSPPLTPRTSSLPILVFSTFLSPSSWMIESTRRSFSLFVGGQEIKVRIQGLGKLAL